MHSSIVVIFLLDTQNLLGAEEQRIKGRLDIAVTQALELSSVGYLPNERDNCAVALRHLEAGTRIRLSDTTIELRHTVLTGHRFAVRSIRLGAPPLSWGMPFGYAIADIAPGDYICNEGVLEELRHRALAFELPPSPNIKDNYEPFEIDETQFQPAGQVDKALELRTFSGFRRPGERGVGTRNYIVVLGTSSRTSSLARELAKRFQDIEKAVPNLDGVVAVSHTEGGTSERPNNADFLVRTLAGFMVHPNVGAVLALDSSSEWATNSVVEDYLRTENYPIDDVLHHFLTVERFADGLTTGEKILRGWLDPVGRMRRTEQPASALNLALQCGGSDAFSGISANPLIGEVAREVIRQGGVANLAETPELVGAEAYVLERVRDLETARRFLQFIEQFKERMSWHGHSPEGNPSGGNRFRGLYNITLKSLGAALKRSPDVRLDYVIDYGERTKLPGYYFMNSPGNDLESIAGQVASGANIIFFTTGNGSITNFPFVPTIKVLSTTARFTMLANDIDLNAGRVVEESSLETEAAKAFELTVKVASSQRTLGEKARHHQVSIWRDWQQKDASRLVSLQTGSTPQGLPVRFSPLETGADPDTPVNADRLETFRMELELVRSARIPSALILPTSLCSSRVAKTFADELNRSGIPRESIHQIVALDHTEGCGVSGGHSQEIFTRILLGYLTHPLVGYGLLLEHGCEKVHNEFLRKRLTEKGISADRFGWASIQLDGGIDTVRRKVREWLENRATAATTVSRNASAPFSLGVISSGSEVRPETQNWLKVLIRDCLKIRANVVMMSDDSLLSVLFDRQPDSTLEFATPPAIPGLHIMESVSRDWTERLTGLGAAGVELILAVHPEEVRQGNPLIPTLAIRPSDNSSDGGDLDCLIPVGTSEALARIQTLIVETVAQRYLPLNSRLGHVDFQVSRGPLGVSV